MWTANEDLRCDQPDCMGFLARRGNRSLTIAAARFLGWSMFEGELYSGRQVVQHLCPAHRPVRVPAKVVVHEGQQDLF